MHSALNYSSSTFQYFLRLTNGNRFVKQSNMEVVSSFCNQRLNPAEQSAVSASLAEIKMNENFENTRFWGKIYGIEHDYLVIAATTVTHQIHHKFFFRHDPLKSS